MKKKLIALLLCLAINASMFTNVSYASGSENTVNPSTKIDFATNTAKGSPYIFGVNKSPIKKHNAVMVDKFKDVGITRIRQTIYLDSLISGLVGNIDDWKANKNDCQNPENWDWSQAWWIEDLVEPLDAKLSFIFAYCPDFLSHNGKYTGVPLDWEIYQYIVKEVYKKYQNNIEWVEVLNEPEEPWFLDIAGSTYDTGNPVEDKTKTIVDYYYYIASAVRSVDSDAVLGGISTYTLRTGELDAILKDPRIQADKSLVQYGAFHSYRSDCGIDNLGVIKQAFSENGFPDVPVMVTEYNSSADSQEEYNYRSVSWLSLQMTRFIKQGIYAMDYYSMFPRHYPLEGEIGFGSDEGGWGESNYAMYEWDDGTNTGKLLPMTDTFKLMSRTLGLGNGEFDVKSTVTNGIDDAFGAINSEAKPVAVLTNYSDSEKVVEVELNNITFGDDVSIEKYLINGNEKGDSSKAVYFEKNGNSLKAFVTMTPYSVVGLKFNGSYTLGDSTNQGIPASSILIGTSNPNFLKDIVFAEQGDEVQLTGTVTPSDATVNWTSSDINVAQVDQTGKVVILKPGTAKIRLNSTDPSKFYEISIVARPKYDDNILKGKTVAADKSYSSDQSGDKATDGNLETLWCALGRNDFNLTIDLGIETDLDRYLLINESPWMGSWGGKDFNTYSFDFLISNDNINWDTVDSVENNTEHYVDRKISGKARYIKLHVNQAHSLADWCSGGWQDALRIPELVVIPKESAVNSVSVTETIPGSMYQNNLFLKEGETKELVATTSPAGINCEWIAEDTSIVSIDNGNVQGLKPGKTSVVVKASNSEVSTQFNVVVMPSIQNNILTGMPFEATTPYNIDVDFSKAVDGDLTTKWCSLEKGDALGPYTATADLGDIHYITGYMLINEYPFDTQFGEVFSTSDFKFEISMDGANWIELDNVTNSTSVYSKELSQIYTARQVRLTVNKTHSLGVSWHGWWDALNIREFSVFGEKAEVFDDNATVEVTPEDITLTAGDSVSLSSQLNVGTTGSAIWVSSNTSVAQVDKNGSVYALKPGTATITAVHPNNITVYDSSIVTVVSYKSPVMNIEIDKKKILTIDTTPIQLTAQVGPSNTDANDLSWKTSDEDVATVSESGLVTIINSGKVDITAYSKAFPSINGVCHIEILPQNNLLAGEGVTVSSSGIISDGESHSKLFDKKIDTKWCDAYKDSYWFMADFGSQKELGSYVMLNAENFAGADFNTYEWNVEISNDGQTWESVDSVTENRSAIVTRLLPVGTKAQYIRFNITKPQKPGTDWQAVRIHELIIQSPVKAASVSLDKDVMNLDVGNTAVLVATVLPAEVSDKRVEWSSDNTAVATVSNSGVITAIAAGTTNISVKTIDGDFTAICTVTVNSTNVPPVTATSVSLDKDVMNLDVGNVATLVATVLPSEASDKRVEWSSDNTAVATVSNSGVITAIAAGTTNISVKTIDGDFTATCTVTVNSTYVPPVNNTNPNTNNINNVDGGIATLSDDGSVRIDIKPILDQKSGLAIVTISENTIKDAFSKAKQDDSGLKNITVEVPKVDSAKGYMQELPAYSLTSDKDDIMIKIVTQVADITVPGNMFDIKTVDKAETLGISIESVDVNTLDAKTKKAIGNRPLINLHAISDGNIIAWNNPNAPITVALDYKPTADELKNPEHLVVYYIDGNNNLIPVTSGRYDKKIGKMVFTTTHFSKYAVAYVNKSFNDLAKHSWAVNAVGVLASKGIIEGTANDMFSPAKSVTRGEFISWLIKSLGLTAGFDSNFSDVKRMDSCYEALGIAKKLGIAAGVGGGLFNPNKTISRQDLITLTIKALEVSNKKLLPTGTQSDIKKFKDSSKVSNYALSGVATIVKAGLVVGSGNNLNPLANTSRAEAAQILYKVYNME